MKSLKEVVGQLNDYGNYLTKLQEQVVSPVQNMCKKQGLDIDLDVEIDWEYSPQESVVAIVLGKVPEKKISLLEKELKEFVKKDIFGEYFTYFDENVDDDDDEDEEVGNLDEIEFEEMEEELEEDSDEDDDEDETPEIDIIFDSQLSFADNPLIITLGKMVEEEIYRIFFEFEYNKLEF